MNKWTITLLIAAGIVCLALAIFKPQKWDYIYADATPVSAPFIYPGSSNRGTGSPECTRRFHLTSIRGQPMDEERTFSFKPTAAECLTNKPVQVLVEERNLGGFNPLWGIFGVFFLVLGIAGIGADDPDSLLADIFD